MSASCFFAYFLYLIWLLYSLVEILDHRRMVPSNELLSQRIPLVFLPNWSILIQYRFKSFSAKKSVATREGFIT